MDEQGMTDKVRADDIAGPVVSQVDTGRADQHYERSRYNQEGGAPPVPSLEEDDAKGEEQSPIGDVGHHMAAGKAVSHSGLNHVYEVRCWSGASDLDLQQAVEEQAEGRKPSGEHRF